MSEERLKEVEDKVGGLERRMTQNESALVSAIENLTGKISQAIELQRDSIPIRLVIIIMAVIVGGRLCIELIDKFLAK